jgi:hypothetical protein
MKGWNLPLKSTILATTRQELREQTVELIFRRSVNDEGQVVELGHLVADVALRHDAGKRALGIIRFLGGQRHKFTRNE